MCDINRFCAEETAFVQCVECGQTIPESEIYGHANESFDYPCCSRDCLDDYEFDLATIRRYGHIDGRERYP